MGLRDYLARQKEDWNAAGSAIRAATASGDERDRLWAEHEQAYGPYDDED